VVTSTTRKPREVYACTTDVQALLIARNTVDDQILALTKQLGDKAPLALIHAAACVDAGHRYAHETYDARQAEFGSPFSDYHVVQPPTRLVSRWRRWLYDRLAKTRPSHDQIV
jgi:hypothetical protein